MSIRAIVARSPLAADPHAPKGWRWWLLGALAGLLALAAVVGVGELVAVAVGPSSTPVIAVGEKAVDLSPHWAKEYAIRHFGSHDKQALESGIYAALIVLSAIVGALAIRRAVLGMAAVGVLALVGAGAALSRPASTATDAIPSLAGGAAGIVVLFALLRLTFRQPVATDTPSAEPDTVVSETDTLSAGTDTVSAGREKQAASTPSTFDRRRFLWLGGSGLTLAALTGGLGRTLLSWRFSAAASRRAVAIPAPKSPAADVSGTQVDVAGIHPFITPNATFYRVDTALVVPQVVADSWSLRIHGMVDHEMSLSYDDLLAMPLIERDITLTCVSNPIGGPYVGNARWVGVPLAPLLKKAGVKAGADEIFSTSADGWSCGTPVAAVMDGRDAMLAVSMNGQPLPLEHGFPVRMIVPGIYGYASATKWLVDIELTTFAKSHAYWVTRGYAEQAPIKTMSRIDVPRALARVPAGTVAVGGVAWAQRKGIAKVEVRVDGGPWHEAQLAAQDTIDTWRQWSFSWQAGAGLHTLEARATDKTGYVQTDKRVGDLPNGATGWQSVVVTVV